MSYNTDDLQGLNQLTHWPCWFGATTLNWSLGHLRPVILRTSHSGIYSSGESLKNYLRLVVN